MAVKKTDDYVFDIMDALRAPVLTHCQAWADTIPKRLLQIIPTARLASLLMKEQTATDPETLAFIYTRTLEAPMSREWTDIYTYLGCKVCEEYWKEDRWDVVGAPREIEEYDMNYFLKPLKKKIYEKRRQILKDGMKQLLKRQVTDEEKNNPGKPVTVEAQLSLF